jgi:hypothetical protein
MARKVRSVTVPNGAAPPPWARYLVMVCQWQDYTDSPSQAFSSRSAAERWCDAASKVLTDERTEYGPRAWLLVYALGADRRGRPSFGGGICYMSRDGGGVLVKRHPIPSGYGVTSAEAN